MYSRVDHSGCELLNTHVGRASNMCLCVCVCATPQLLSIKTNTFQPTTIRPDDKRVEKHTASANAMRAISQSWANLNGRILTREDKKKLASFMNRKWGNDFAFDLISCNTSYISSAKGKRHIFIQDVRHDSCDLQPIQLLNCFIFQLSFSQIASLPSPQCLSFSSATASSLSALLSSSRVHLSSFVVNDLSV